MGLVSWLWGGDDMEPDYASQMVGKPVRYHVPCALGNADIICCSGCGRERCKCDPDLGRPARWWEC